jgi:hypothetical protein
MEVELDGPVFGNFAEKIFEGRKALFFAVLLLFLRGSGRQAGVFRW